MRHRRRNIQRIVRLAAVGGLVCGGLMVSSAMASEPSAPGTYANGMSQAADPVAGLVTRLGASRTAGSWTGADGRPVVAVTDEDAAAEVRDAGARAEVVRYSMRRLRDAAATLGEAPRVAGTAWAVDYASNRVMVHADSTVSTADWSRMSDVAEDIGESVHMERTTGTFTTRVNGAVPIFSPTGRCSAGFNVTDGRNTFILTAGHCGPVGTSWFRDRQGAELVGTTTAGSFPGNDFSLVRYETGDSVDRTNVVDIGDGRQVQIIGAADPAVGQRVFRSGSTSGFRSGKVTAVNATVNYPEGTVTGLIETTVCAESGDSGGPLFSEGLALGVTSGGSGDCTTGGVTFFQPATKAMEALGVRLAAGAPASGANGAGGPADTAPSAAAGAVPPGSPGSSGSADGLRRVTGIVDFDFGSLGPGLVVIGASLAGLLGARWILSAQERREFRSFSLASWG
ncbi:serine protease [Streptomyces lunaelactis]|uniref:Serine protease n=1 Tax=Streptomyces lunaelactis TaxID=1535768 RepID=A0A2R4T5H5_9ACTN|nr:S1 family peptidase [Streptomyces lunaelactis]AVZ74368.1 serine protease [Streptomyces lunaelactis]NUK89917.1 S1 family peptidase [Streptomyces lunaelactis]